MRAAASPARAGETELGPDDSQHRASQRRSAAPAGSAVIRDEPPVNALILAAGRGTRLGGDECRPKCLRPVGGRPILLRALDALEQRGVRRLILVTGHARGALLDALSAHRERLAIEAVHNADFDRSEHGWSLFLARAAWRRNPGPTLFMDADNVFDPVLLDRLVAAGPPNRVLVDSSVSSALHDEELVTGSRGRITGFVRGRPGQVPGCVGAFVGMNRLSARFMRRLFEFMDAFFARSGPSHKYERVLDALCASREIDLRYADIAGVEWVNVNYPQDLARAERVTARIDAARAAADRRPRTR